ncbi:hypothetical protein CW311_16540 [Acinetobacter proteolyticus]|uniref:Uncharacterized protein n=1 Tax=Acinetobacter proteolyticus TaxID=1776741 RepID=A0A2N0WBF4_9GAMM|nr:hypothetical protein CW311_16540 [Acinetobacter proteolyticus]
MKILHKVLKRVLIIFFILICDLNHMLFCLCTAILIGFYLNKYILISWLLTGLVFASKLLDVFFVFSVHAFVYFMFCILVI